MDSNPNWKRDIFLIPLVVGLLILVASYLLPKLFDKGKRLSYTVDGPTAYFNPNAVGTVKVTVTVDGVQTPNIYGYKVRLWNSGSVPLTVLPVRFAFEPTSANFHIFNVTHETIPKKEFGKIEESGSDSSSKRFVYELLNPKDEDVLTFVTDLDAPLSVFAKSENLRTELVETKVATRKLPDWTRWASVIMAVVAVVGSLITMILQRTIDRKKRAATEAAKSVGNFKVEFADAVATKNPQGIDEAIKAAADVAQRFIPEAIPVEGKPGFFKSPYAPSAGLIDARGFPSGIEMKDPFTKKILLIPQ